MNTLFDKFFISSNRKDSKILVISLHADEFTSLNEIQKISINYSYNLVYSIARDQGDFLSRNIFLDPDFSFDPNRIFTDSGIEKCIKIIKDKNKKKIITKKIYRISNKIKNIVSQFDLIFAIHNNYGISYTIKDYLSTGLLYKDCKKKSFIDKKNPSDFFLTTDQKLYEKISTDNIYNVLFQDNTNVVDDGSLSVYCAKKKIKYINLEVMRNRSDINNKMIKYFFKKI